MKTLNIFIASSYELSEQRAQIGDYIRRLSYNYSPRGVRLKLACWEDFYPEYSGISKQQEYDEHLIKTCDIFIAMFRARCGIYTQHEVRLALSLNKDCHILQLSSSEAHDELDDFLASLNITAVQCGEYLEFTCIGKIIDNHLQSHNISLSSKAIPLNTWRLYATIPDDSVELRVTFSNIVRSLESLLEETFGNYFTLYPYRTPQHIASTDHYLCFMKDIWNYDDEQEVEAAYKFCIEKNLPETTILYQLEGHSGEENNSLAIKLNSEYQAFSRTFSNLVTIKDDLKTWAMRHKMPFLSSNDNIFRVEGDYIYCYDRPFYYLLSYPELHSWVTYITASIVKIEAKIKRNIKDGIIKNKFLAKKLAAKRYKKELQLQYTLNNWYNKVQLLECTNLLTGSFVMNAVRNEQYSIYRDLSHEIKKLTVQCENASFQFLSDFASKLSDWEEFASVCLSSGDIHASEYFQVLTHIVRVCDTYFYPMHVIYDEDEIFKKIIDTADKYDNHTLFTETMRVNFANSFNKNLDFYKAGKYYRDAYDNIMKINDDSVMAHHYKSYVISSLLHYFVKIDNKQSALDLGKKYESLIWHWQETNIHANYDVDLIKCYSAVLSVAPKYYGVYIDLVEKTEVLLEKLQKKFDTCPYDKDYFDAICYSSIVLSTYYIDRYEIGNTEYFTKAIRYLNESQASLQARYPYDPLYIQYSLSQPLHNRGFLYSKAGRWKEAIEYYRLALNKRKEIYDKYLNERDLFEIAQTLVNIGDAYRMVKQFNNALKYADEAITIYNLKRKQKMDVFDMLYYEAYQLKATILMDIDRNNKKYPGIALDMMQECIDWSNAHPTNDYVDRFNGVSGKILNYYKKR